MPSVEGDGERTLFRSHFNRIQRRLEAEGKAARSFHHGLNRGLIREAFVREFLTENLSGFWGVGTGEIFHGEASDQESRNQIDVVIHNKRYPKLPLSAGIDLFLIETVSNTIEVKSRLTKNDLKNAAAVAKRIKNLANFAPQSFNPTGMVDSPRPYSFIFAYDGPAKIETVLKWMIEVSSEDDYGLDDLMKAKPEDRAFFNHLFLDGVFVLGKGFVLIDSLPFQSHVGRAIQEGLAVPSEEIWIHGSERELELLWVVLTAVNEKLLWSNFDFGRYLGMVEFRLGQ